MPSRMSRSRFGFMRPGGGDHVECATSSSFARAAFGSRRARDAICACIPKSNGEDVSSPPRRMLGVAGGGEPPIASWSELVSVLTDELQMIDAHRCQQGRGRSDRKLACRARADREDDVQIRPRARSARGDNGWAQPESGPATPVGR